MFSDSIASKTYNYSDRYEQTLQYLYETIKDKIEEMTRLSLDEFLAYCCYFIVKEIRTKSSPQSIEDYLKSVFLKLVGIIPLHNVRTIQFDATVDDKQTRCITVENPNSFEYA